MPRIYLKKGTRTGEVDEDAMKSAMKQILDKTLSIRKSAQKYGVKPATFRPFSISYLSKVAATKDKQIYPFALTCFPITYRRIAFPTKSCGLIDRILLFIGDSYLSMNCGRLLKTGVKKVVCLSRRFFSL
ncbi:hypothetical protein PYW07_001155 [Mythimna separata]|uniref:HTH psq-type domain-containing protein n=1 Tax=Mythimna separata TaxID=271217 RepID=A0AAD7YSJ3_MYTSE|nr:hypothetical protein PYW07_001155 [Mythimna separata]